MTENTATEAETSLHLAFGDGPLKVRLKSRRGFEQDLRDIALGCRTAVQLTPTVLEVETDDLITNIRRLSSWRDPKGVVWDRRLHALVGDSLRDAQAVERRLGKQGEFLPEVSAEEVVNLLGDDWKGNLTAFQRRDVAKLLSLTHGANFSVPGAGKTRVGLAVFQALRERGDVEQLLIVGPKSSYGAWIGENEECLRRPPRMEVLDKEPNASAEVVIVNYERLAAQASSLGRRLDARPSMMILDEAHRMKLGAEGTYGAVCLALGPHAKHRYILTGTPAPNGVKDLENLFGFVWPGTGRRKVVQAVGGGDLKAASAALRPLFTRTTKNELGLPKVTPRVHRVRMTELHREVYEALLGRLSARAAGIDGDLEQLGKIIVYLLMAATSPALLAVGTTRYEPLAYRVDPLVVPAGTNLSRLLEELPKYELSPKYRETLEIVRANAAQGRKTLVWSTFVRSLNTLKELLSIYEPAMVFGGSENREAEIERFREDPNCMVLLSNPATLGEGISLHHECHDAVYVDRDFAAGRFLQSLDRIHRLGLAPGTDTRVTVLVAEDTIDEVVEDRLKVKLDFMGRILDDPAVQELSDLEEEPSVGGGLDAADLHLLMGHLRGRST